jgi:hypothetical protein
VPPPPALSISSHDLTPQLWPHYQNVCIIQKQAALEQYATSPHLAASTILCALEREDVGPGRTVLDLGCGTGMLAVAWQVSLLFFERTAGWPGAECGWWGGRQHPTLLKSRVCVKCARSQRPHQPLTNNPKTLTFFRSLFFPFLAPWSRATLCMGWIVMPRRWRWPTRTWSSSN